MNEKQKKFLEELHELLLKYNIDTMIVSDDRIAMQCDNNSLAFTAYIRRDNGTDAYFDNIESYQNSYHIKIDD